MSRAETKRYYVRRCLGMWGCFTFHPIVGETRPPKNRKPFIMSESLPKLMDRLNRRIKRNDLHHAPGSK